MSIKLDLLNRQASELHATLGGAIGLLESDGARPRLGAWSDWIRDRFRTGPLRIAVAGETRDVLRPTESRASAVGAPWISIGAGGAEVDCNRTWADLPGDLELLLVTDAPIVCADVLLLGELSRDCVGLAWLGGDEPPAALVEAFADSPLGLRMDLGSPLGDVTDGPLRLSTLATAAPLLRGLAFSQALRALQDAVVMERGRTTLRVGLQAFVQERKKTNSSGDQIEAQRESLTDLRRMIADGLQEVGDGRRASLSGGPDMRPVVLPLMAMLTPFTTAEGQLVDRRGFSRHLLPNMLSNTMWTFLGGFVDKKWKLTFHHHEVDALVLRLENLVAERVEDQAEALFDRFDRRLTLYLQDARDLGVELEDFLIGERQRRPWRGGGATQGTSGSRLAAAPSFELKAARADLQGYEIEVTHKGVIGKFMRARSLATMTGSIIAVVGVSKITKPNPGTISISIVLLAAGLLLILLTGGRVENMEISNRWRQSHQALLDKIAADVSGVIAAALESAKQQAALHRTLILDRLDRTLDGLRRTREPFGSGSGFGAGAMLSGASQTFPRPEGMSKAALATAMSDVRAELSALLASKQV